MEKEIKKLHRYFRLLFYEEYLELWKKLSIAICVCGLIFLYLQHQSWNLALSITGLSLFVLEKVVSIVSALSKGGFSMHTNPVIMIARC